MIVTSQTNRTHGQVVLQKDHASLALQIAEKLGNDIFLSPEPRDLMLYLARHHDHGWDEVDQRMTINPSTGLPYSLVNTPIQDLLQTGPASVDFNETHHPLCGLLASMHIWGLYNGRYGLSDKIVVDLLPDDFQQAARDMLSTELVRQDRLKHKLADMQGMVDYLNEDKLFQMYKQLQFFDTLSLYFNEYTADSTTTQFHHVPTVNGDVTVTLTPTGQQNFTMSPYPFSRPEIQLQQTAYREEVKLGGAQDYSAQDQNQTVQTFTLVDQNGK